MLRGQRIARSRRLHVGLDARAGLGCRAPHRAGAEHLGPHGARGLPRAASPDRPRKSPRVSPVRWRRRPTRSSPRSRTPGVVGLGGAAFPTHVKLKIPEGKYVDTLIINGVECEPYLTTDHRVMLEQREDVFMGIRYLLRVTGAGACIVGVEANKPDAAEHLRKGLPARSAASVELLPSSTRRAPRRC